MGHMRICIVGSGAVGGFHGAMLARAGHDVTFVARGAHLAAIRAHGLRVRGPLGDFTVRARAEERASAVPPVDLVIFAVKAYSNAEAIPLVAQIAREHAVVLTLQNGVDSVDELAAAVGPGRVLGGTTYVATALAAPGLIEQTGTHRRIAFGEVSGDRARVSDRVHLVSAALAAADIVAEPAADGLVPIWEKFCYLAPFAGFTGAARVPIGPLWADADARRSLTEAFAEVEAVATAEGVTLPAGVTGRISAYIDAIPPETRSSLLIDLQSGRPIEVEALLGAAVRRGRRHHVPTPVLAALYAVLRPHASGKPAAERTG
jgi:2-dehydropantoate 2-reductase